MLSRSKIGHDGLLRWGSAMAQDERSGLWLKVIVRPRWYWKLKRLALALWLFGRRYEPRSHRFGWHEAWGIARCAEGLSDLAVRQLPWAVTKETE